MEHTSSKLLYSTMVDDEIKNSVPKTIRTTNNFIVRFVNEKFFGDQKDRNQKIKNGCGGFRSPYLPHAKRKCYQLHHTPLIT